ncbi:CatB-related O-acetyltransferase [Paracoccus binzhouensis]|uniref:CatB-related O-acetyltransferase n=1 Tax=Paracoccus binzhouensis TaxID=2796149 RepID=UPI0018EEEFCC|nr:CatB-related O-acetyltransferase [Paracoccus binzhouensis]
MSTQPTLFSAEELRQFHKLDDPAALRTGNIRGPHSSWDIKGNARCGKYTSINGPFAARGRVMIGKYCAFGRYVALLSGNHRTDLPNQQLWLNSRFGFMSVGVTRGPIEIGHNVWIGDKVSVLSGVTVGHGAVIGAGSTVVKPVPAFAIVGGNPAREIRYRFSPAVIEQMLGIRWWDWSDERIARNKVFFETPLSPTDDADLVSLIVD